MTPRQRQRRRMIDRSEAGRQGRRYYAFYQGYKARRTGRPGNPYKPGTPDHACWEAGWEYACDLPDRQAGEEQSESPPPVCRFGPGGDYVHDWPEGSP